MRDFWKPMPVSGKLIRELLLLFLLLWVQLSYAQRITRQYNNVSFSAALKDLNARQHKYTINFVYDELEDFRVTKSIRNQSVPDAIMQLIGFYPIRMTQVEDNIMVECTQKTPLRYKGRIIDESGNAAEYANIALLSPIDSTIVGHGVSNENGSFVIPCNSRKVLARITYVGYKTISRIYSNPEMGIIKLQPETMIIKGEVAPYPMPVAGGVQYVNIPVEIDTKTLSDIAQTTDGNFYRATNNNELKKIYKDIDKLEKTKFNVKHFAKRYEAYQPFALAALLILLVEILLRITWFRRIP